MVKLSKLVTLIMRPIYPHKKQIKINYEAQFSIDTMLNDEIGKRNSIKKKDTKNNSS
jgi:hypothetical protein